MITTDLATRIRGDRQPHARKTGRNPRWPYVPVIRWTTPNGTPREKQILGRAFATRHEAVEHAERYLQNHVEDTLRKLGEKRYRALREQYGLPREIV